MKGIIVLLAAVTVCFGDDGGHGESPLLTEEEFKTEVAKEPHFVMFFAPWCGHCKRLAPVWDEMAKKLNSADPVEAKVARVDCTAQTQLCSTHGVSGYPTLKFFAKGGEDGTAYRGARDQASLEAFIQQQLRGPEEKEEVVPAPTDGGVVELTESQFDAHIETGHHFIMFFAPWCGHCKAVKPTFADLAKHYENDDGVSIARVDCTSNHGVCSKNGVKGYPTFLFFSGGQMVEKYQNARNLDTFIKFIESHRGSEDAKKAETHEKIPDATETAEEPKSDGKKDPTVRGVVVDAPVAPVKDLTGDSFSDGIASGMTFVKFFAPWCGHCKRLAPTWEDLGKKFADTEGVTIAKVDCTQQESRTLCQEQKVDGFPTLTMYVDGAPLEEYDGALTLPALVAYTKDPYAETDTIAIEDDDDDDGDDVGDEDDVDDEDAIDVASRDLVDLYNGDDEDDDEEEDDDDVIRHLEELFDKDEEEDEEEDEDDDDDSAFHDEL